MDVHSPEKRSFNMSKIKGKNTKPEVTLRKLIWSSGYRYRIHYKRLPGKPDIVFPGRKKVIFVHGCFWHRHSCKYFKWPSTNKVFWQKKITKNVERDFSNCKKLAADGWQYFIVWECELKTKDYDKLLNRIIGFVEGTYDPRSDQIG